MPFWSVKFRRIAPNADSVLRSLLDADPAQFPIVILRKDTRPLYREVLAHPNTVCLVESILTRDDSGAAFLIEQMSTAHAEMQRDGYTVLRRAVASSTVCEAKEACAVEWEAFKSSTARWIGGGALIGHINFYSPFDTELLVAVLMDHAIAAAVRSVLGADCCVCGHAGNVNMPGSRYQPDHVDGRLGSEYVLLSIPLGDVDETNGAIELYPGSHRVSYSLPEFFDYRRTHRPHRVSTEGGDLILRYPNVWHRGTPNRSPSPRFMLGLRYGPLSAEQTPFVVRPDLVDILANAPIPLKVVGGASRPSRFAPNYFSANLAGWTRELLWCYAPSVYDLSRRFRRPVSALQATSGRAAAVGSMAGLKGISNNDGVRDAPP